MANFLGAAARFDLLFSKFMIPFLKGAKDEAERSALRKNIHRQHQLIEAAKANLEPDDQTYASRYQDQLIKVASELDKREAAPAARGLLLAVADAEDARVNVMYALRVRQTSR